MHSSVDESTGRMSHAKRMVRLHRCGSEPTSGIVDNVEALSRGLSPHRVPVPTAVRQMPDLLQLRDPSWARGCIRRQGRRNGGAAVVRDPGKMVLLALVACATLSVAASADPPVEPGTRCRYARDNGLYWSTYTGSLQKSIVHTEDFAQAEAVLALDYVAGVAHYQNWSTVNPRPGVHNWTVLDALFAAAARRNKSVILGLQMGVCAPAWLLRQPNVSTVRFVPNNVGWFAWASLQSRVDGEPVITAAKPWENPAYESAVEDMVRAMATRYAHHPALAYVNVCGLSAAGGVEANFNVNYLASRRTIPGFDSLLGYTQARYASGWKRRIDLYLSLFPGRVGMATHDQPGDYGWEDGAVVRYTQGQKMQLARSIRDHLLASAAAHPSARPTPVVRNCGGSNNTLVWGVPNATVGGSSLRPPPGTFAQLLWEVRGQAAVGVEQAQLVPRQIPVQRQQAYLSTAMRLQTYYNARYVELKTLDLVNHGTNAPFAPLQAIEAAQADRMRGCCLPWNCSVV